MTQHEHGLYISNNFVGAEHVANARTSSEMLAVEFEVSQFAVGGSYTPIEPFRTVVRVYLTEKMWSSGMVEKQLEGMGFNGDFKAPDFSPPEDGWWRLICKHESFDGRVIEKWEMESWAQDAEPMPVAIESSMAMTARWQSKHGTKPAGQPMAPPPAPAKASTSAPVSEARPTGTSPVIAPLPPLPDGGPGEDVPFDSPTGSVA